MINNLLQHIANYVKIFKSFKAMNHTWKTLRGIELVTIYFLFRYRSQPKFHNDHRYEIINIIM